MTADDQPAFGLGLEDIKHFAYPPGGKTLNDDGAGNDGIGKGFEELCVLYVIGVAVRQVEGEK